jgi:hypothetical protein
MEFVEMEVRAAIDCFDFDSVIRFGDTTNSAAEANLALKQIHALRALEKHQIEVRWDKNGARCISRNGSGGESYFPTAMEAILALSQQ